MGLVLISEEEKEGSTITLYSSFIMKNILSLLRKNIINFRKIP